MPVDDLELEAAARKLVDAEVSLGTLQSSPAVLKFKECLPIANAAGIGGAIVDWKTWVESLSNRKTIQSNPALRLETSGKTLPEGCIFTDSEVETVRDWLRQKQEVVKAQAAFNSAITNRAHSIKEKVRERSQESKAKKYPTQAEIAAKKYTEVAL
jgi:hypothetical protein